MKLSPLVTGVTAGLIGGIAASWVMNRYQKLLSKVLEGKEKPHGAQAVQDETPQWGVGAELQKLGLDDPEDNAAERTAALIAVKVFDRELSRNEKHRNGTIAHYAFGATTGAIYGAAAELSSVVSVGAGLPFGAAVWVVADEIVVPGLGLSKPPTDYPVSKHAIALSAHLVYGLTTDIFRRLARTALMGV